MSANRSAVTGLGKGSTTTATSLGASASSAPRRAAAPSKQQKLFSEAEKLFPDLDTAISFLHRYQLIPQGDKAILEASLSTSLLHFAFASPAQELARKGLIAFALLSQAVFAQHSQDAAATTVAEHVETQIQLCLDHHTSQMEDKLEGATEALEQVRKKVDGWVERLENACTKAEGLESKLEELWRDPGRSAGGTQAPGTSATTASPLTIETAPVKTRRAVSLAELLQRQLLVRGAALKDPEGKLLSDREALERARRTLDLMGRDGLTPPANMNLEEEKIHAHGDVVYTLSNAAAACWFLRPHVATAFSRKMGMEARIVERLYKLVAEGVLVSFEPNSAAGLRAMEEAHGLEKGAVVKAEWIKPVERRHPGQRTAYLMLTISGVEQANRALRGLTILGRKIIVRRELIEPKRCAKCQSYDGHFARECPAQHDTCTTCAGQHPTSQCDVRDPGMYGCACCAVSGHAAWDRTCPAFRAKVRAHVSRRADSGFRFFVTNNPETWVEEEQELAHAPPPPTVWSQIQHRLDGLEAAQQGPEQSRLDRFFSSQQGPAATHTTHQ